LPREQDLSSPDKKMEFGVRLHAIDGNGKFTEAKECRWREMDTRDFKTVVERRLNDIERNSDRVDMPSGQEWFEAAWARLAAAEQACERRQTDRNTRKEEKAKAEQELFSTLQRNALEREAAKAEELKRIERAAAREALREKHQASENPVLSRIARTERDREAQMARVGCAQPQPPCSARPGSASFKPPSRVGPPATFGGGLRRSPPGAPVPIPARHRDRSIYSIYLGTN